MIGAREGGDGWSLPCDGALAGVGGGGGCCVSWSNYLHSLGHFRSVLHVEKVCAYECHVRVYVNYSTTAVAPTAHVLGEKRTDGEDLFP